MKTIEVIFVTVKNVANNLHIIYIFLLFTSQHLKVNILHDKINMCATMYLSARTIMVSNRSVPCSTKNIWVCFGSLTQLLHKHKFYSSYSWCFHTYHMVKL